MQDPKTPAEGDGEESLSEGASATLSAGSALATSANGDIVYLMEGHAETYSIAAAATLSKTGVTYQGLGNGRNRPVFTFDATASQVIFSGANCTYRNLVFDWTGVDAIVAAFSVTAADVAFEDCEFVTNSASAGVTLGILTAATAARVRVSRCRFLGSAANSGTTTTAHIKHEVGVDYVIEHSYFTGKLTQSILNATAVLRGSIHNNVFVIATGTKAISVHSSSTPFITNNYINVPSGTAPIVAAAGFVAGNEYSAAAGVTAGTALTI